MDLGREASVEDSGEVGELCGDLCIETEWLVFYPRVQPRKEGDGVQTMVNLFFLQLVLLKSLF